MDALRRRGARIADQLGRLQMRAFDLDEVGRLLDDFETRFESHSNPERKNLLHKLVKEVRVQSKATAEVWKAFPRPKPLDSQIWLAGWDSDFARRG